MNRDHAARVDATLMRDIEQWLAENVRTLWRITREYASHDGFYDVFDATTGQWSIAGCDCNVHNKAQLGHAIARLRDFRRGVYHE